MVCIFTSCIPCYNSPTDVNSVSGLLRRIDVSDAGDVSEVYAASIFSVKMCRLLSSCAHVAFCFEK
jgi:hypothetical protein